MQMWVFHFQARNRQVHKHALFNDAMSNSTIHIYVWYVGCVRLKGIRKKWKKKYLCIHTYTYDKAATTDAQPKTAYLNSFHARRNYRSERFSAAVADIAAWNTPQIQTRSLWDITTSVSCFTSASSHSATQFLLCSLPPIVLFVAGFIIAIATSIRSRFCFFCHRPFSHSQWYFFPMLLLLVWLPMLFVPIWASLLLGAFAFHMHA